MKQDVKLMDSGTVLFKASTPEEAMERVRVCLSGGNLEVLESGLLKADFSDGLFERIITARVEACSTPGNYAVSFQEGNRCRFPLYPFPSRKALRRMERIKRELSSE